MRLELRHLRIVCAIADSGSVTKAAAALGLAQPALAAQLKRIERTIGGSLFARDRHGARPTALGELVLSRARILLPAMQGLEDEASRLASNGGALKSYRIGSVSGPILSGLVHRLTADHPQVVLTTHTSWSTIELAEMLATGRLDYALVGTCGDTSPPAAVSPLGYGVERAVTWQLVAVDAVFVLLPESHPLAAKDEVDLADLAGVQWVATPGDSCLRDCFAAACSRAGFTVRNLYEGDVRTCVELVEAGTAAALCQSSFRPPPGLVCVPIAGTPLRWRHLLGWHPEAPAARQVDQILRYAVAAYQDAVSRLPRYARWLAGHPEFGVQPV
ncbi:MAG: LysR family transcriptional regulator [Micromonosporaceae bacterium]|nr:LysR family transcriptional regulator [Micromonosporaceae bacterium]